MCSLNYCRESQLSLQDLAAVCGAHPDSVFRLLAKAGFQMRKITPTPGPISVVEAVAGG